MPGDASVRDRDLSEQRGRVLSGRRRPDARLMSHRWRSRVADVAAEPSHLFDRGDRQRPRSLVALFTGTGEAPVCPPDESRIESFLREWPRRSRDAAQFQRPGSPLDVQVIRRVRRSIPRTASARRSSAWKPHSGGNLSNGNAFEMSDCSGVVRRPRFRRYGSPKVP